MSDTVLFEQEDAVATITLNRPDALNGFVPELNAELLAALEKAHNDDTVRSIVLTGAGRAFSAGADLNKGFREDRTLHGVLQYEHRLGMATIAQIPKPVIAAVHGFAAGVGLSYALQCDLMVMGEDAFMLSPFTTISLVPDGGMNWHFVRQLGYRRAYQLSIESERVPADRCLELGLTNKVVPGDEVLSTAQEWAKDLGKKAPLSLAATKKVMRHAMDNDWASSYDMEADLQRCLGASTDAREGVQAFFEKRAPEFKGK